MTYKSPARGEPRVGYGDGLVLSNGRNDIKPGGRDNVQCRSNKIEKNQDEETERRLRQKKKKNLF